MRPGREDRMTAPTAYKAVVSSRGDKPKRYRSSLKREEAELFDETAASSAPTCALRALRGLVPDFLGYENRECRTRRRPVASSCRGDLTAMGRERLRIDLREPHAARGIDLESRQPTTSHAHRTLHLCRRITTGGTRHKPRLAHCGQSDHGNRRGCLGARNALTDPPSLPT